MDEMTLRQEHTAFYRWSKRGNTPKAKSHRDVKAYVSFFGGLSLNLKKEFLHLCKRQNTKEMIFFLENIKNTYASQIAQKLPEHLNQLELLNRTIVKEDNKIYEGLLLICLDGAGFHRSKKLREYLNENYGIFELFRFPTYSPELNPQEHVWKALRKNLSKVAGVYSFPQTVDRACRFLMTEKFNYEFV